MKSISGSLVLLDIHTATPTVMWNGNAVLGVRRVHVNSGKRHVCISVKGTQTDLYASMRQSGVGVKELKR